MALTDLSPYTPRVLTSMVQRLGDGRENFLLNNYFTQHNVHAADMIDFGVLQVTARVLVYAKDGQEAIPYGKHIGTLNTVRPTHIRSKIVFPKQFFDTIDPTIEGYTGLTTNRNDQITPKIAREQMLWRRDADRTLEVQCAQALSAGTITIVYEDGATATVSMGYTGDSLTVGDTLNLQPPLEGTNLWTANNSNPFNTIEDLINQIKESPGGQQGAFDVIMGYLAWKTIMNNPKLLALLDNRNVNIGQMSPTAGAIYKGIFNGVRIFQYSMGYVNSGGTRVQVFDPKKIVVLPQSPQNFSIEYGAVYDFPGDDATMPQYMPVEYFSRRAVEKTDPPIVAIYAETNPLALIKNPAAIRVQQVVA